jgi:CRP-like cAMP-binding protein
VIPFRSTVRGTTQESPKIPILSRELEILRDLEDGELKLLEAIAETRDHAAESAVLREGAAADALYFVLSGKVRVTGVVVEGDEMFERDEQKIVKLDAGEVFGEMSFLTGEVPALSVIADGPVQVAALPQKDLRAILDAHPLLCHKIYAALVKAMVKRLRATSRELFLTRYFLRQM